MTGDEQKLLGALCRHRCLTPGQCGRILGTGAEEAALLAAGMASRGWAAFVRAGDGYAAAPTEEGAAALAAATGQGLPPFRQVSISPRAVPHQVALNEFALRFGERARAEAPGLEFSYWDGSFGWIYAAKPDGAFRFPALGLDFLVEQDMGTESRAQLLDKWARWRLTLPRDGLKRAVLFVIGGIPPEKIPARRELAVETAMAELCLRFSPGFDAYAGSMEEMLDAAFLRILPDARGRFLLGGAERALLDEGFALKKAPPELFGAGYGAYAEFGDAPERYLVDSYAHAPLSVLSRAALHGNRTGAMEAALGYPVRHLILADDAARLSRDLALAGCGRASDIVLAPESGPIRARMRPAAPCGGEDAEADAEKDAGKGTVREYGRMPEKEKEKEQGDGGCGRGV